MSEVNTNGTNNLKKAINKIYFTLSKDCVSKINQIKTIPSEIKQKSHPILEQIKHKAKSTVSHSQLSEFTCNI